MSLKFGKEIMETEAAAIRMVADRLDKTFEQALDAICECGGRLVCCGMGKAGIIAQKISATLSSTGTQSFFLHPADGLHGDVGMVNKSDVVLILSNSGESDEIVKLVPCIRAIGAKIIAVTANERSALAAHADITLLLGHIEEACPLGLAPSATTTAMLALGDAIALTLMRRKGFEIGDYAKFHPAGALGRKSQPIENVMRKDSHVAAVTADMSVGDVLVEITRARAGAAVVVDDSRNVLGIFCDGDLRRGLEKEKDFLNKAVSSVMTANCKVVKSSEIAADVLDFMREKRIGELPVVDDNDSLVGLADMKGLIASL